MDQQAVEGIHLHVREVSHGLAGHDHAFLEREHRRLAGRYRDDGHHHPVEDGGDPLDHVQVAHGQRVERPRIDGCLSHTLPALPVSGPAAPVPASGTGP